ncbi:MAG: ABC transporter ATP-binding protein [Longimicrobiales bacterium]|nr:ABC transporter ATP-binding protein [Longimicrobiales bacterium]
MTVRAADPGWSARGGGEGERPPSELGRLWRLLHPWRWRIAGLAALISATAALSAASPQFVRYALDEVIPSGEPRVFGLFALVFALFYVVQGGMQYAGMYQSFAFTQSVIADIRMQAWRRLLRLPVSHFAEERSGSLTSRVVNDVNALEAMIQAGATRLAGQLFSIVVIAIVLVWMNWTLALVNLVVIPLVAGITRHYQEPLRKAAREIRRRVGEMNAVSTEAIGNIQVVKSFVAEEEEEARLGVENDAYVEINLDRRRDVGYMEGLITLSAEWGVGALLLIGGWMVVEGGLSVGELTAFVLYQRQLQRPVISVMFFNNQLQAGMAALDRVSELLDAEPEVEGDFGQVPSGDLDFEGIVFTYPGTETPALDGLDLTLEEGRTAALVGSSGSGKTTVTRLISRFHDPQEGRITLGGIDLREFRLAALRTAVAIVPQEPTLFSGSVAENIGYADPEASRDRIERAARLANAEEFIRRLPRQYDTAVGERGVKLSGGQKQRIAIARAILKDARILVLDEATSSLDSESEAVIQDALGGLFQRRSGMTSLVIAHRLSTIETADVIHVLEQGRCVESGTHAELLSAGGRYAALWELQHQGEGVEVEPVPAPAGGA